VNGRSDVDFESWVDMDLEYIDTWSFGQDLKLLLLTIPAVLSGRGAY
jgi:lipopolysaccharide/colanic/teichoic acid biosynthesis glycosyltransferase